MTAFVLLGAGCVETTTPAAPGPEEAAGPASYVGTWVRQATYTDGQLMHTTPARLELSADTYISSASCVASGTVAVQDNAITMTLDSTDCPTGVIPDVYHSTFEISEDGNSMTLINTEFGAEVREDYIRQ